MQQVSAYSQNEEIANAITHGLGVLLSVAGLTLLVTYAAIAQEPLRIISFSIYGASLILLFLASTLYHGINHDKSRQLFKLLDHCAIYILIAGTYTPLMLVTLRESVGLNMLMLIWGVAIAGVSFKLKFGNRFKGLSLLTYIGMGWMALAVAQELQQHLAFEGLVLLGTGGLVYSLGVVFYVQKRIPYNHAIWHLFVLGGAMCHFFLMLFYV